MFDYSDDPDGVNDNFYRNGTCDEAYKFIGYNSTASDGNDDVDNDVGGGHDDKSNQDDIN